MSSAAETAWDALDDRERAYLTFIYEDDRDNEQTHRSLNAKGMDRHFRAREWRRIQFNGRVSSADRFGRATLEDRFRHAGLYDRHTATLTRLHRSGLIELDGTTRPIYLWLTKEGRSAARAGLADTTEECIRRAGLLPDYLWRDLVTIAVAGDDGVPETDLWWGIDRALTTKRRPFIETRRRVPREVEHLQRPGMKLTIHEDRCYLTEQGRAHYVQHLTFYREVYPQVTAPELDLATGEAR
jgi:hypothetical protein